MQINKRAFIYKNAFEEKTNGVINYGRVVKALKGLFAKYPDDSLLYAAFKKYLDSQDIKYLSIERFAATAGAYFETKAVTTSTDPYSD